MRNQEVSESQIILPVILQQIIKRLLKIQRFLKTSNRTFWQTVDPNLKNTPINW